MVFQGNPEEAGDELRRLHYFGANQRLGGVECIWEVARMKNDYNWYESLGNLAQMKNDMNDTKVLAKSVGTIDCTLF